MTVVIFSELSKIWIVRPIIYSVPFMQLIHLWSAICLSLFAYLCMAALYGHSHRPPSGLLKSLWINYYVNSGTYPAILIQLLSIVLLRLIQCLLWCTVVSALFCLLLFHHHHLWFVLFHSFIPSRMFFHCHLYGLHSPCEGIINCHLSSL